MRAAVGKQQQKQQLKDMSEALAISVGWVCLLICNNTAKAGAGGLRHPPTVSALQVYCNFKVQKHSSGSLGVHCAQSLASSH